MLWTLTHVIPVFARGGSKQGATGPWLLPTLAALHASILITFRMLSLIVAYIRNNMSSYSTYNKNLKVFTL